MDAKMRMTEPLNDNQRADARRYLQGVPVGGVCAGPLNPVVWQQQGGEAEGRAEEEEKEEEEEAEEGEEDARAGA
jgi:hypothetical protein